MLLHFLLRRLPLLMLLSLLISIHGASAATLNVPAQFGTIQSAVNAANNGDVVLIADGTYIGNGNRDIDFGGKNLTVTSQNGPSRAIINCQGSASATHRGFYLHSGETNAVIRGLTIENGYEMGNGGDITGKGSGGGILDFNVGVTVQDCIIQDNVAGGGGGIANANEGSDLITVTHCAFAGNVATAGTAGGGILNDMTGSGAMIVTACTLTNNIAGAGGFGAGGGIADADLGSGAITVSGCTLTGNSGPSAEGGGIFNTNQGTGPITVADCTLAANTVGLTGSGVLTFGIGGGIANTVDDSGSITVIDCTLIGNTALNTGGGISNYNDNSTSSGSINITGCTLTLNAAQSGSGIYSDDNYTDETTTLTSDILYGDSGDEIGNSSSPLDATAANCDVQGDFPAGANDGGGNLSADPLFVNAAAGDYHLRLKSPCIGAGTSSAPGYLPYTEDYQPRPNPPSIGAYEAVTARLAITSVAASRSGGTVTVTASIHNLGNAEAAAVQVIRARLGSAMANAPLPGPYTIPPGGVQTIRLMFTTRAKGRQPISIQGTSSGPSFSAGQFLAVP